MERLIKDNIRDVPDFPKPGILFKDITPILSNPKVFDRVIATFADRYRGQKIDAIVGIEARGFIFGSPLARELKTSFIPIRKQGKLPYTTTSVSYDLEYGSATVEMHVDAVKKGQRVVVIDDLLATGGTANAACELVEKQGGKVVECAFVVELEFLNGRKKITQSPVLSLARYS